VTKNRRVAVAVNMSYPVRHHYEVVGGIQRYAREHAGWECVVEPYIRNLQKCRGKTGYDGIVGRASADLARQAAKAGVPLVNVWAGSPVTSLPCVTVDWEACGRMAAEHLLLRGFRQFAFQGIIRHRGTPLAAAAFKASLRAAKCGSTNMLTSTHFDENAESWSRYMARLERWIRGCKTPLGVFSLHDYFCRHMADACLHLGLHVPEDVALIGLGNEMVACTLSEPSLSSIDVGWDRVGYEAAALLDRLMAGKPPPETPIFISPKELVVRRSTDVSVVDNPLVAAALRYIAEHSHEYLQVADVAKHVHTTVRSLSRHFLAAMGRTMTDEIARLRLERAKRLLVESNQPIKQLAMDCGFSDATYFGRVFLQAEGVTPSEFRRQRLSGKEE